MRVGQVSLSRQAHILEIAGAEPAPRNYSSLTMGEIYIKKEVFIIIKITQSEAQMLRNAGYGECVKISSVTHKSRAKRYWAVEEREVLWMLKQNAKNSIVK